MAEAEECVRNWMKTAGEAIRDGQKAYYSALMSEVCYLIYQSSGKTQELRALGLAEARVVTDTIPWAREGRAYK